jgi:glutaminase
MHISGVSRSTLNRKLPKLSKWLNDVSKDSSDISLNQYFRYHTVSSNSHMANHAMFYNTEGYLQNDYENVYQYYSQNGYVTGSARDACEQDLVLSKPNSTMQTEVVYHWDHEAVSYTCDYNYDMLV